MSEHGGGESIGGGMVDLFAAGLRVQEQEVVAIRGFLEGFRAGAEAMREAAAAAAEERVPHDVYTYCHHEPPRHLRSTATGRLVKPWCVAAEIRALPLPEPPAGGKERP